LARRDEQKAKGEILSNLILLMTVGAYLAGSW